MAPSSLQHPFNLPSPPISLHEGPSPLLKITEGAFQALALCWCWRWWGVDVGVLCMHQRLCSHIQYNRDLRVETQGSIAYMERKTISILCGLILSILGGLRGYSCYGGCMMGFTMVMEMGDLYLFMGDWRVMDEWWGSGNHDRPNSFVFDPSDLWHLTTVSAYPIYCTLPYKQAQCDHLLLACRK